MKTKLSKAELTRIISYILLRHKSGENACYFNNTLSERRRYFVILLKNKFIEIVKIKKVLNKKIIFIKPTPKLLCYKFDTNKVKQNE
jgi:hypothetical protein